MGDPIYLKGRFLWRRTAIGEAERGEGQSEGSGLKREEESKRRKSTKAESFKGRFLLGEQFQRGKEEETIVEFP